MSCRIKNAYNLFKRNSLIARCLILFAAIHAENWILFVHLYEARWLSMAGRRAR
jgi:hypothetical protein